MSVPLAEALEQVDLNVGSTYCCLVKGRWVEVRVLAVEPPRMAKPLIPSDVRLDPWPRDHKSAYFSSPEKAVTIKYATLFGADAGL